MIKSAIICVIICVKATSAKPIIINFARKRSFGRTVPTFLPQPLQNKFRFKSLIIRKKTWLFKKTTRKNASNQRANR